VSIIDAFDTPRMTSMFLGPPPPPYYAGWHISPRFNHLLILDSAVRPVFPKWGCRPFVEIGPRGTAMSRMY